MTSNPKSAVPPRLGYCLAQCPPALSSLTVCACCLAPATLAREERALKGGLVASVPYCDACLGHRTAASTRIFAAACASGVLALGLSVILPLVFDWPSPLIFSVCFMAAWVPGLVLRVWQPEAGSGHASFGQAVWWTERGEIAFANRDFALLVAAESQAELSTTPLSVRMPLWVQAGAVCVMVAFPFLYWLYHPVVRVINLGDEVLTVWVDGDQVARVEPSSLESRAAGVKLRVKFGARLFEARGPSGKLLDASLGRVQTGAEHLYAPKSIEHCFWLETTHYGRTTAQEIKRTALISGSRFFQIPAQVDTWFGPNPAVDAAVHRSTGGALTALRQARCKEAPLNALAHGEL